MAWLDGHQPAEAMAEHEDGPHPEDRTQGDQDEARRWYGKAIEWMEKQQTADEELLRLRAEAAELLKITDQKATTKPQSK